MTTAPAVALKGAKVEKGMGVNPTYICTKHGLLNILEVVFPLITLILALVSELESTSTRLLLLITFSYLYTSTCMLMGGICSPYTQAYLPLSLYFMLYHLVGSCFFLVAASWIMTSSEDHGVAKAAAGTGIVVAIVHFIHGLFTFMTVFNVAEVPEGPPPESVSEYEEEE
ncbi:uncharacterized protein LOC135399047 isoform X2 [Ornithodoros turicata]